jgi:hypothetical protein
MVADRLQTVSTMGIGAVDRLSSVTPCSDPRQRLWWRPVAGKHVK